MIKSTVAPRPRVLHAKPTRPVHRTVYDWQNFTTSLQGNVHSCGAIDYATSAVSLCFCRTSTTSTNCFKACRSMVAALGFRLEVLRMDNDIAFRSNEFVTVADESHTTRVYAAPYSRFQNGLIERTLYTLAAWHGPVACWIITWA